MGIQSRKREVALELQPTIGKIKEPITEHFIENAEELPNKPNREAHMWSRFN